jgi:hypothetical protein
MYARVPRLRMHPLRPLLRVRRKFPGVLHKRFLNDLERRRWRLRSRAQSFRQCSSLYVFGTRKYNQLVFIIFRSTMSL